MYTSSEFKEKALEANRDYIGNFRFLVLVGVVTGGLYYFELPSAGIWGVGLSLIAAVVTFSSGIKASLWDATAYLAFYLSELDKKRREDDCDWLSRLEGLGSASHRPDDL